MAANTLDSDEEIAKRQEKHLKSFMEMEPEILDLEKLAHISYQYVWTMLEDEETGADQDGKQLTVSDIDEILYLLTQLVHSSVRLRRFYKGGYNG